jgi:hypothetical protein
MGAATCTFAIMWGAILSIGAEAVKGESSAAPRHDGISGRRAVGGDERGRAAEPHAGEER